MNEADKHPLLDFAMSFYANEPCRICGANITQDDLETIVYAGSSADNKARAAHKECWDKKKHPDTWAHP